MLKRVVVTGASSGIGAAAVRRFAELGWQTVAVARREDRLRGDAESAKKPYENVTPLSAEDVARVLVGAYEQPPHVNQDLIVLRPVAQSSVFHTHRGPLEARG